MIGFSYYGDSRSAHHREKKYFQGIKNNLELLLKYYPDNWIIRYIAVLIFLAVVFTYYIEYLQALLRFKCGRSSSSQAL